MKVGGGHKKAAGRIPGDKKQEVAPLSSAAIQLHNDARVRKPDRLTLLIDPIVQLWKGCKKTGKYCLLQNRHHYKIIRSNLNNMVLSCIDTIVVILSDINVSITIDDLVIH